MKKTWIRFCSFGILDLIRWFRLWNVFLCLHMDGGWFSFLTDNQAVGESSFEIHILNRSFLDACVCVCVPIYSLCNRDKTTNVNLPVDILDWFACKIVDSDPGCTQCATFLFLNRLILNKMPPNIEGLSLKNECVDICFYF